MAINFPDNIKVNVGNPIDSRYLNNLNQPYVSTVAVTTAIVEAQRYVGLTVLIDVSGTNTEYWFKEGVTNGDLIEKKYDTQISQGDYVTGATNMGYFSGRTGVQRLQLVGFGAPPLDGCYYSQFNYYYVDSTNKVRIGEYPHSGAIRRAYVNTPRTMSWIYNVPTNSWVLTPNDVVTSVGSSIGCSHVSLYPNSSWSSYVSSGGTSVTPTGSLTTGATCTYGSPIYSCDECQDIHFRTLVSKTPANVNFTYDENFIYLSGKTPTALNVGTGTPIYVAGSANPLEFRSLVGGGFTTITQAGNNIVISSSASGGTFISTITGGTNGLSTYGAVIRLGGNLTGNTNINGVGVHDLTLMNLDEFQASRTGSSTIIGFDSTGIILSQSGGSVTFEDTGGLKYAACYHPNYTNRSLVDKEFVQSSISSGGTYNLGSPSAIPLGGICSGTVLTGKTAFQLFEELLVPELCGAITPPSTTIGLTCSGIKEIGTVVSQTVTGTFSRGSIAPQYCSASPFRSGCADAYCFTGTGMPSGLQTCALSPATATNVSYIVISGVQPWGVCTRYAAGSPALGSKGTQFSAALSSGCTAGQTNNITGILPWYWGVAASGIIDGTCVANGTKVVATVTSSTPITFNASAQYLWFAAPTGTFTAKTKWWVCAANAGTIGGVGDTWAAACSVTVTSAQGCWASCPYSVYVTCGVTTTDVGVPMCLYI